MNDLKLISLFFILTFGFFLVPNTTFCQNEYSAFQYTSKNGLPQNSVKSLALDTTGFLWMTTESGLVRFDGRNFKIFNTINTPELLSDRIHSIIKTQSGQLLMINTFGSLYAIRSNSLEVLLKGDANLNNFYSCRGLLPDANFYINTITPSYEKMIQYNVYGNPLTIFPINSHLYYIRTNTGIALFENFKNLKELRLDTIYPSKLFLLNDHIYVFTKTNKLYLIGKNLLDLIPCKLTGDISTDSLFYNSAIDNVFGIDNNSDPCIQIENHLFEMNYSNDSLVLSTRLITDQLPVKCIIHSIIYSRKKQFVAVGTDTKGLYIFKKKNITTIIYDQPEERTNNAYYAQIALDSNTVLTNWQREFSIQGAKKNNAPFSKFLLNTIFTDKKKNIWFGNFDTLYKFDKNTRQLLTIKLEKYNRPYSLFSDGDSIWLGREKTISYIKNDILYPFYQIKNPTINTIPITILRGMDNKLWFCNYSGVFRINTTTRTVDTIPELYKQFARTLYRLDDKIFIGTYGSGYYVFYRDRLTKLPLDRNNYLSQVHSFLSDKNGYIWMTTNQGLFKTKLSEIENYVSDTTSNIYYYSYGEENGILNTEFNGGCTPSSIKLDNGYFSFPSMEGLVWLKPDSIQDLFPDAPILIDKVEIENTTVRNLTDLWVPANTQNFQIFFSTPYWGNKNNLLLEYKLEGYNKKWIPLFDNDGIITFSNLSSGNYNLQIRKRAGFGKENYTLGTLEFTVAKKFYETSWFMLLVFISAILIIGLISNIYAYRIKRRNRQLEEKVNERTAELSFANEQLTQSVNIKDKLISIISHDIVTPLRFISMVARKSEEASKKNETESLQLAITDIKNTSEKLYGNAQNILNWMKHQNKRISVKMTHVSVAALVDDVADSLKELAAAKNIIITNDISYDDIIKTDQNILPIILHNLLSNAIKFTENGTITFSSHAQEEHYIISVTDNGSGIRPDQLERIQNIIDKKNISSIVNTHGDGNNGLGYLIITELTDMINGKIMVSTNAVSGTTVKIILNTNQQPV